jgi:hypothetical protein
LIDNPDPWIQINATKVENKPSFTSAKCKNRLLFLTSSNSKKISIIVSHDSMWILLVIGANAPFKVVLMIVLMSLHVLGLSTTHRMQAGASCAIHRMFSKVIAVWMDRRHLIRTKRSIQQLLFLTSSNSKKISIIVSDKSMWILLVIGANALFKVVLMIVLMSLHVLGLSTTHRMQAGASCAIHRMFSKVIAVWMDRRNGIRTKRSIQQTRVKSCMAKTLSEAHFLLAADMAWMSNLMRNAEQFVVRTPIAPPGSLTPLNQKKLNAT